MALPEYIDVTAPGHLLSAATGDGSTNDRANLQAIFDWVGNAANADGGTVYFPAGVYLIDSSGLTISSKIRLMGDGMFVSIIKYGANYNSGSSGLSATSKNDVTLEDLGFDASVAGSTLNYMFRMDGSAGNYRNGVIRNCRFASFQSSGKTMVEFDDMDDCLVDGCIFDDCWYGLSFHVTGRDSYRNICTNCEFLNFRQAGFYSVVPATEGANEQSFGFSIVGCRFHDPDGTVTKVGEVYSQAMYPLLMTGGKYLDVYHNNSLIAHNVVAGDGVSWEEGHQNCTADQIAAYNAKVAVLIGNTSVLGGDNGIAVWPGENSIVVGNGTHRNDNHGCVGQAWLRSAFFGNAALDNGQAFNEENISDNHAGIAVVTDGGNTDPLPDLPCTSNLLVANLCTDDQEVQTQDWGVRLYLLGTGADVLDTQMGCNAFVGNHDGDVNEQSVNDIGTDDILGTLSLVPQFSVIEEIITMATAESSHSLAVSPPDGSFVRSVQAVVRIALGGTATGFSIGIGSDTDLYGSAASLSANTKLTTRAEHPVSGTETIAVYGVGGTIGGGSASSSLRVRIVYELAIPSLPSYT